MGRRVLKSTNLSDMVMEYSDSLVHCGGPNVRGITRDVPPIDTSKNAVRSSYQIIREKVRFSHTKCDKPVREIIR